MGQLLTRVIPADTSLMDRCRKIQSDINRLGLPITWVKPDDLFLVINNLGRLNREQIPPLHKTLTGTIKSFSPFSLALDFVQTLYLRHEPSQIYLSPAKNADLADLQTTITEKIRLLSIPQPVRYFPQIVLGTLARADPTTTKHFLDKIGDYDLSAPIDLLVDKLYLLEILMAKKTIHHQKLATFSMPQSLHDLHQEESPVPSTPGTLPDE